MISTSIIHKGFNCQRLHYSPDYYLNQTLNDSFYTWNINGFYLARHECLKLLDRNDLLVLLEEHKKCLEQKKVTNILKNFKLLL